MQITFSPVLDINNNPRNPIINFRSYGDDVNIVSQFGTEFINNKFWCVEAEALRKRLDEVKAIPL